MSLLVVLLTSFSIYFLLVADSLLSCQVVEVCLVYHDLFFISFLLIIIAGLYYLAQLLLYPILGRYLDSDDWYNIFQWGPTTLLILLVLFQSIVYLLDYLYSFRVSQNIPFLLGAGPRSMPVGITRSFDVGGVTVFYSDSESNSSEGKACTSKGPEKSAFYNPSHNMSKDQMAALNKQPCKNLLSGYKAVFFKKASDIYDVNYKGRHYSKPMPPPLPYMTYTETGVGIPLDPAITAVCKEAAAHVPKNYPTIILTDYASTNHFGPYAKPTPPTLGSICADRPFTSKPIPSREMTFRGYTQKATPAVVVTEPVSSDSFQSDETQYPVQHDPAKKGACLCESLINHRLLTVQANASEDLPPSGVTHHHLCCPFK